MQSAINKFMESCIEISNNREIPCNIVDWASDLYDKLSNQHDANNCISVRDLVLIDLYSMDANKSLYSISHDLMSR